MRVILFVTMRELPAAERELGWPSLRAATYEETRKSFFADHYGKLIVPPPWANTGWNLPDDTLVLMSELFSRAPRARPSAHHVLVRTFRPSSEKREPDHDEA